MSAPPGDLAAALRAARAAARHWFLSEPELLRSGMNAIYTTGPDTVLRVSRPTSDPAGMLFLTELLGEHGVRVPRLARSEVVEHEEFAVFAFERIHSVGPTDWRQVGQMVGRVHHLSREAVGSMYPLPSCRVFPWWQFDELLGEVGDALDARAAAGIRDSIERNRNWDAHHSAEVVCHGDVHPGNVVQGVDGPVLLDWDLMCVGPPAWDHAPMMTWAERWGGEPGQYEAYAEGYGRSLRADPVAVAIAELRLVAATLMRVRAGFTNPAARLEAERRLRYWRGEVDPPTWTAQ